MEPPRRFRYRPMCSEAGCDQPAVFKIAAVWSDGTSRELKNYGLACSAHCGAQSARAKRHRDVLKLQDWETVGDVRLYRFDPDRRDIDLECVVDGPSASDAP
jgi:hypothetical protein